MQGASRFFSILILSVCMAIQAMAMEIKDLQFWSQDLINDLYAKYNVQDIYIGGGSARSFLDHLLYDQPLKFRDFDLVVNMNQKVTFDLAAQIGKDLQSDKVGVFLEHELRPRPRTNPKNPNDTNYNAGFGFFFSPKGTTDILDLTLMHSYDDVRFNGILNIDRLRILIPPGLTLSYVAQEIQKLGYHAALKQGLIDDPDRGYLAWRNLKLKILDDIQLLRDPLNITIRIIRGAAKINALPLDKKSKQQIMQAMANTPNKLNQFQGLRNLIKLLEDPSALKQLQEFYELGLLEKLIPNVRSLMQMTKAQVEQAKSNTYSSSQGFNILATALNQTPPRQLKGILRNLFLIEPKGTLQLMAELNKNFADQPLRVGYFTGEFAPFHRGHKNVIETALKSEKVDFVFVIPTPHATNSPKTKEFSVDEWLERIRFSELGLENLNQAAVFPSKRVLDLSKHLSLAQVLKSLTSYLTPQAPLTHIMGGDSFLRVIERGFLDSDPRPRLVVTRLGIPNNKQLSKVHDVIFLAGLKYPVSATQILQQLAMDLHPKSLSPEVLKEIKNTIRYRQILEKYRYWREKLQRLPLTTYLKPKIKTLVIYNSFNYDGSYHEGLQSPPKNLLAASVKAIATEVSVDKVLISMKDIRNISDDWLQFKLQLSEAFPNKKIIFVKSSSVELNNRIDLMHVGVINGLISNSMDYVYETLRSGTKYVLYEASGVYASPLLQGISGVDIYKEDSLRSQNTKLDAISFLKEFTKSTQTSGSGLLSRSCIGFLN